MICIEISLGLVKPASLELASCFYILLYVKRLLPIISSKSSASWSLEYRPPPLNLLGGWMTEMLSLAQLTFTSFGFDKNETQSGS